MRGVFKDGCGLEWGSEVVGIIFGFDERSYNWKGNVLMSVLFIRLRIRIFILKNLVFFIRKI